MTLALDTGQVLQHHLGAVLRRRTIELRTSLSKDITRQIGELAIRQAHALDVNGHIRSARGADQLDER
jgi:hypothetical protein